MEGKQVKPLRLSAEPEIGSSMTITCPACAHTNDIVSESPLRDWQLAACSACEANFILVNPLASQGRLPSGPSSSRTSSWWRRIRLWTLGVSAVAAETSRHIQGGMFL